MYVYVDWLLWAIVEPEQYSEGSVDIKMSYLMMARKKKKDKQYTG